MTKLRKHLMQAGLALAVVGGTLAATAAPRPHGSSVTAGTAGTPTATTAIRTTTITTALLTTDRVSRSASGSAATGTVAADGMAAAMAAVSTVGSMAAAVIITDEKTERIERSALVLSVEGKDGNVFAGLHRRSMWRAQDQRVGAGQRLQH